jgi:hypothetical protein
MAKTSDELTATLRFQESLLRLVQAREAEDQPTGDRDSVRQLVEIARQAARRS